MSNYMNIEESLLAVLTDPVEDTLREKAVLVSDCLGAVQSERELGVCTVVQVIFLALFLTLEV